MKKQTFYPSIFVIYIIIWTIINQFLLTRFPFMHTDEAWLAGLSRTMLQEANPAATENFFNLMPRAPHAIKLLYHFLQIIFIKVFGYSLFSTRLLSVFGGALSLAAFGRLCRYLGLPAIAGTVLLSLEIQFIYASRFGRQEIFILLFMILSLNLLYSEKRGGFIHGLLTGLPVALAVGFHPNAFIAAWPAGLILLSGIIRRKRRPAEGAGFLLAAAAGAVIFLLLSLRFNTAFTADYGSFGSEVGFFDSFDVKLLGFDEFYRKLFLRVSGTYYTPNLIPIFAAAAAGLIAAVVNAVRKKTIHPALFTAAAGIIGVNAGIILIGKYSAPSIVFLLPFLIILILCGIDGFTGRHRPLLCVAAAVVLLINSGIMIAEEVGGGRESYNDYVEKLSAAVPADARTLGGLNAGFYFDEGCLLDWRNLAYLDEAGISLPDYIENNGIEYIIYTDEIDLIYRSRPVWNILYGNPTVYYEQLQTFLAGHCELVAAFDSPCYGTRLTLKRYRENWGVRIYRVK